MIIENTAALKEFLIVNLSKLCDADPAALTKYVLALLKKNRPESELREFLLDQLDVFLLKQTPRFVDLLLQALKTKAYIENAPASSEVTTKNDSSPGKDSKKSKSGKIGDSKPKGENNSETHIPDVCVSSTREYEKNRKGTHTSSSPKSKIRGNTPHESPPPAILEPVHTPSLPRELETNTSIPPPPKPVLSVPRSNYMKRCENYDQLGYCLQGSLCAFDHGCDPILVEDVSTLSLSHNFNVCPEDTPFEDGPSKSPLPPLPTTSPPPLPPLPPVYLPEPYNPESPGMGASYYPPMFMPTLQPPPTQPPPPPPRIKPQRTRELIGVPTVNSVPCDNNEVTEVKEKRKPFDFSRLGPPPKKFAKTESILELRKVPSNLNTISLLNSHFSKFGRIVNIEVAYDNDPEAALVKFASPMEAANAYKSSVAIFNNRFIKVFYHTGGHHRNHLHQRIDHSSMETDKVENNTELPEKKVNDTITRKGNLSRTVYIPTPERVFHKNPIFTPDNNHFREVKKDKVVFPPLEKQLELLRKKQEFLKCSINHQKIILAKLMKCKKKKEAEFLKKTIDTISTKITALKSEIETESLALKKQLAHGKASLVTKSEKELLDAEMDRYKERKTKIEKTKEAAKLLSQVSDLKEEITSEILGDDEEEDEEDSEARSWRR